MTREREEQTRKIFPLRIRETNTQLVGWRICLILDHHCSRQTWRYSSPMTITTITKKHAREMNVNFWLSFVIFCFLPFENSAGLFQRTWIRFYRILYKERKRTDVENMEEKNVLYQKKKAGRTGRCRRKELLAGASVLRACMYTRWDFGSGPCTVNHDKRRSSFAVETEEILCFYTVLSLFKFVCASSLSWLPPPRSWPILWLNRVHGHNR